MLKEKNENISDKKINDNEDVDNLADFKSFQQDYMDFKKYVWEQFNTIKDHNLQNLQLPSDTSDTHSKETL